MSENKIRNLLDKYIAGNATDREIELIDRWYNSLSGEDYPYNLSDAERQALKKRYWESLQPKLKRPEERMRNRTVYLTGIAAAISAVLVLSILYFNRAQPAADQSRMASLAMMEVANDSASSRAIFLLDGSKVNLSPGSTLKYGTDFRDTERKVYLTGEASFDISRDEARPFYVFAGEVVTKVLGTSFTVRAYPEDQRITVSVSTGKVSVYTYREEREEEVTSADVILEPNQQAVYTRDDQKVALQLVDQPQVIISEEEVSRIRFEHAPLPEIFRALERMYGVDIVFDEEVFSECSITTSVDGTDLYERIDVICEITGAKYEIRDTQIFIQGTGCN